MLHAIAIAAAAALTAFQAVPDRGNQALPAFGVTAPDGAATPSAQLSSESQWVLVYINPASTTSKRLLQAMKEWETPQLVGRTTLIIQGQPDAARAFVERAMPEELRGIRWFADTERAAWQALGLTGSPVLMGIRQGRTEWRISGVLSDPDALKSLVLTWVRY